MKRKDFERELTRFCKQYLRSVTATVDLMNIFKIYHRVILDELREDAGSNDDTN